MPFELEISSASACSTWNRFSTEINFSAKRSFPALFGILLPSRGTLKAGHRSSSIRPMINDNLSCSEAEGKMHSNNRSFLKTFWLLPFPRVPGPHLMQTQRQSRTTGDWIWSKTAPPAVFQYQFNQSRMAPPSNFMLSCVEYLWLSRNLSRGQEIRPPNLIHIDYGVCVSLSISVCPTSRGDLIGPFHLRDSARKRSEHWERLFHLHEPIFQKLDRVSTPLELLRILREPLYPEKTSIKNAKEKYHKFKSKIL